MALHRVSSSWKKLASSNSLSVSRSAKLLIMLLLLEASFLSEEVRSQKHKTFFSLQLTMKPNKLEFLSLASLSSPIQYLHIRPEAYHRGEQLKVLTPVSFGLNHKYKTGLKRLATGKDCCIILPLHQQPVKKVFITIDTRFVFKIFPKTFSPSSLGRAAMTVLPSKS